MVCRRRSNRPRREITERDGNSLDVSNRDAGDFRFMEAQAFVVGLAADAGRRRGRHRPELSRHQHRCALQVAIRLLDAANHLRRRRINANLLDEGGEEEIETGRIIFASQ